MRNRKRREIRNLDQPGDDLPAADASAPWNQMGTGRNAARNHRKAAQLCRQVARTLHYVLHGDGSSDLLNSLSVVSVLPAPDTARLLVVVQSDLPGDLCRPAEVIALLESQTGRLRSEIARSIHRKKTPGLMFQLAPPAGTGPESPGT